MRKNSNTGQKRAYLGDMGQIGPFLAYIWIFAQNWLDSPRQISRTWKKTFLVTFLKKIENTKNLYFFWHSNLAQDLVYKNLEAAESTKYTSAPDFFFDIPKNFSSWLVVATVVEGLLGVQRTNISEKVMKFRKFLDFPKCINFLLLDDWLILRLTRQIGFYS